MKLSEMTTDQATDFLIRVAAPIANIMEDKETPEILKKFSGSRDLPVTGIIANILPSVVAFATKKHKDDLYEIVGAFCGKPAKEVGKMNIMDTMKVLREGVDRDFLDFFK